MKKFVPFIAVVGTLFIAGTVGVIAAQSESTDDTQLQPKTVAISNAPSNMSGQNNMRNSSIYNQIMQSQKEMNERMSKFMNDPFFSNRMNSQSMPSMSPQAFFGSANIGAYPRTNFYEKDNNYIAQFVIPGMEKDNLSVEIKGNVMTVSAKNNADKESNDKNYQNYQSVSRAFTQSINIPTDVDVSKITSNYKNGVLTITLPKDTEKKAQKTINITVG